MKRLVFVISFAFAASVAQAVPFEELLFKGRAAPFYDDARGDTQKQIAEAVKKSQFAERMANLVNGVVRLKTNLNVGFASCGQPNAFYNRQKGAVVVCYDLIELMAKLAKADADGLMKADRKEFGKTIDGALWGIFFHELGHAIIGVNHVPITGREEDVADQFSLYFATNFFEPQGTPVVQPMIWYFTQMGKARDVASIDQDMMKRLMSNEHSLDQQRVFNLACWALGANASRGYASAQYVGLPQERAGRCSNEYATLNLGIRKQFQKYLKLRPQ